MIDYGTSVSRNIMELSLLKDKAYQKDVIATGLYSICKKSILNNYLMSIGNLMLSCGNLVQQCELLQDTDTILYRFKMIQNIHQKTLFCKLYEDHSTHPKLVFLFEVMQRVIEDTAFERISDILQLMAEKQSIDRSVILNDILDVLYDLAENSIFHLSGLKIKCDSLSDHIFEDPFFEEKRYHCKSVITPDVNIMCGFDLNPQSIECLHIFMTPSLCKIHDWLIKYVGLYTKYHINPKNIIIVVDYKIMDKIKWNDKMQTFFDKYICLFDNIYLINTEDKIDFSDYEGHSILSHVTEYDKIPHCPEVRC